MAKALTAPSEICAWLIRDFPHCIYMRPKKLQASSFPVIKVPNFFRGMFCGGFQEQNSTEVRLPEENAAGFQIFLEWVLAGELGDTPEVPGMEKGEAYMMADFLGVVGWLRPWFDALRIADKFGADELLDLLHTRVDCFHDRNETMCDPRLLGYIADIARPNSRLEKFIPGHFEAIMSRVPSEQDYFFETMQRYAPDWVDKWARKLLERR